MRVVLYSCHIKTKYQRNQTLIFWKLEVLRIDLTDCHQFAPDVKEECHNCVIMFLKAYPKKDIHATEEEKRKNSSILPTLTAGSNFNQCRHTCCKIKYLHLPVRYFITHV